MNWDSNVNTRSEQSEFVLKSLIFTSSTMEEQLASQPTVSYCQDLAKSVELSILGSASAHSRMAASVKHQLKNT